MADFINNANISNTANIAYSKLNLFNNITDNEISLFAGISYI